MPRLADIYSLPAGTDAITDRTIDSGKYNLLIHDIEDDLNEERPIVAGGTGASTATDARANLFAERSMQQVTDYDTHVWEAGSFFSATSGVVGEPVDAHAFAGIAFGSDASNMILVATDQSDGTQYMRRKSAGVWGSWAVTGGSDRVLRAGDTMTGNLVIKKGTPALILVKTGDPGCQVWGYKEVAGVNLARWNIVLGSSAGELGANSGSDFVINRFDDAGVALTAPLSIARATGALTITGNTAITGTFAVTGVSTLTGALNVTGAITATAAILSTSGTFWAYGFGGNTNRGVVYLNQAADRFLHWDGTNYVLPTAPLSAASLVPTTINYTGGTGAGMWYNGQTTAQRYFLGMNGTGDTTFRLYSAAFAADVFSYDSTATLFTFAKAVAMTAGIAATSSTTGTLRVTGGMGVSGAFFSGSVDTGNLTVTNTGAQVTLNATSGGGNAIISLRTGNTRNWDIYGQDNGPYIIVNRAFTSGVQLASQAATSWSAYSSRRIKDQVEDLAVLDTIEQLRAVRYRNRLTGAMEIGVIAEELAPHYPELVQLGDMTDDDGSPIVTTFDKRNALLAYDRVGAIALQGVRELAARLRNIEGRV